MWTSAQTAFCVKVVCLVLVFMLCLALAGAGIMVNIYVVSTRAWLPEKTLYSRSIFLEYDGSTATGQTSFIQWHQLADGTSAAPDKATFLTPGQTVDIALHLDLPDTPQNRQLFMVSAQLLTQSNRTLSRFQRQVMLPYTSPVVSFVRHATLLPFYLLGVMSERRHLRVPMFKGYREPRERNFQLASVSVQLASAHPPRPPPSVYDSEIRVSVRVGWIAYILSLWRPGVFLSTVLLTMSVALIMASLVTACITLWLALSASRAFVAQQVAQQALPPRDGGAVLRRPVSIRVSMPPSRPSTSWGLETPVPSTPAFSPAHADESPSISVRSGVRPVTPPGVRGEARTSNRGELFRESRSGSREHLAGMGNERLSASPFVARGTSAPSARPGSPLSDTSRAGLRQRVRAVEQMGRETAPSPLWVSRTPSEAGASTSGRAFARDRGGPEIMAADHPYSPLERTVSGTSSRGVMTAHVFT